MTPRIRFRHWLFRLPGMMGGIVLYPYILFRQGHGSVMRQLYRHELEHFYQVQRDGWLRFYVRWLWFTFRHGYWDNPYEVEAREAEGNGLTEEELAWWEAARHSTKRIG
jgi:hypothetical protein